jgi:hypothetical protein
LNRAFYSAPVSQFLSDAADEVLGILVRNNTFDTTQEQRYAWSEQISIFQRHLCTERHAAGHLFFEYAIPRMGKRVDAVLILNGAIFVVEFKVGERKYPRYAIDQVEDYGLDLKNFHSGSHDRATVPVLVATEAEVLSNNLRCAPDKLYAPLLVNKGTLVSTLENAAREIDEASFDPEEWADSIYAPTPTIVEAAQALYRGHNVAEITRSDSGAKNLSKTASAIDKVITGAKANGSKSICFITGVPGSGKTLAGLNIANERHNIDSGEHAVFLSGNGPLVNVLREALARDRVSQAEARGESLKKRVAKSETEVFIQNIHHFRDDNLVTDRAPIERVAVFDEAQRAWTLDQAGRFMKAKRGIPDFAMSEPEFLIDVMDRHDGYAVIVCLIGGGQEINTGEAGLPEWFAALSSRFQNWHVYMPGRLRDYEYGRGEDLPSKIDPDRLTVSDDLHLAVSVRSYRAETVSSAVKHILDGDKTAALEALQSIQNSYPIVLTRSLDVARRWLQWKARGTERYGIVASSGALRLKPCGLNVKATIDPVNWFLNDKADVRSSYYLEDVASEFDVQGLELDWACVAWDANFFRRDDGWVYRRFSGTKWQSVNDSDKRLYLKNAYRVLLTRARQGMIIYVPPGDDRDPTRLSAPYNSIAEYLLEVGVQELSD